MQSAIKKKKVSKISTRNTSILISTYEVVAQWKKIEYENLPDNVDYLVKNNILTGVKVWKGEIFVTVSRWLPGVPSALNKVVKSRNETFNMQPFPSWELQEIGTNYVTK